MQDAFVVGLGWLNGLRLQESAPIKNLEETMAKLVMAKTKLQTLKTTPKAKVVEVSRWGQNRGGRPWRRLRQKILERDNYTCVHCGKITVDLEVDHVVNLAAGGTDDWGNLQSLCVPCHKIKTAKEANAGVNNEQNG